MCLFLPLPGGRGTAGGRDRLLKSQRLLLPYVKSNGLYYSSAILLTCLANLAQSYSPRLLGKLTDGLERGDLTPSMLLEYTLLLLGTGLAFGILGMSGQSTIMRLGRKFEAVMRQRLFDHFTGLSESFYSKQSVGGLLSYFMNDVTAVREALSRGISQSVNSIMLIVSAITMMLLGDVPLLLIAVCVLPLTLIPVLVYRFKPLIRQRSLAVQESLGRMTASAEEQICGIRVTKKFAAERTMLRRFEETVDRIRDSQVRLVRVSSLFQALIPFLGSLSLAITLGFGGYLTIRDRISLGDFVALTLYVRMMVNPLQQIGNVINTMQRSQASFERLGRMLSTGAEDPAEPSDAECDLRHDTIRIRGLSFAYPEAGREVLHDIDLTIKPGRTVGILGKTGSGKTTLVKLLLRMYEPPAGTIAVGGVDIRQIRLESLRRQIAYVPQDGFLFSTTIRDNIAFYRRDSALGPCAGRPNRRRSSRAFSNFPTSTRRGSESGALRCRADSVSGRVWPGA